MTDKIAPCPSMEDIEYLRNRYYRGSADFHNLSTRETDKLFDCISHLRPELAKLTAENEKLAGYCDRGASRLISKIDQLDKARADLQEAVEALRELVVVAELRGDSDLPHPSNDDKLWTARMQDAWDDADNIVAAYIKIKAAATANRKDRPT
jgi:hypothetical protein